MGEEPKYGTIKGTKTTYKYKHIWWAVFIVIVLLVVVITVALFYSVSQSRQLIVVGLQDEANPFLQEPVAEPYQFNPIDNNVKDGSAYNTPETCQLGNGFWSNGRCNCNPPYRGAECQLEKFSKNYFPIGSYSNNDVCVHNQILKIKKVDNLAFPSEPGNTTCEGLCNRDTKCVALVYDQEGTVDGKHLCKLLKSEPVIDSYQDLKPDGEEVFLNLERSIRRPRLSNRILLFPGEISSDFWYSEKKDQMVVLEAGQLTEVPFHPTELVNDGDHCLVISAIPFSLGYAKKAISSWRHEHRTRENCYVYDCHHYQDFKVPAYSEYWAMMVTDNMMKSCHQGISSFVSVEIEGVSRELGTI